MRKRHVALGLAGVAAFAFMVLTADPRVADGSGHSVPAAEAGHLLSARVAVHRAPPAAARFHAQSRVDLAERYAAMVATAPNPEATAGAFPRVALSGVPAADPMAAAPAEAPGLLPLPAAPMPTPVQAPVPPVRSPMPAAASATVAVEPLGRGRFRDRHGVYRPVRALVTAYCPCGRCCGSFANGITAMGTSAWREGAAADPKYLDYGTRVYVPGYGLTTIDDTGGAMRQSGERGILHLDMRMTYHYEARQWGRKYLAIRIYE